MSSRSNSSPDWLGHTVGGGGNGPATGSPVADRRRKVSVFAVDGFPDIRLLDQQNLKARWEPSTRSSIETVASTVKTSHSESSQTMEPPELVGSHSKLSSLDSSSSSRASSCDEPIISGRLTSSRGDDLTPPPPPPTSSQPIEEKDFLPDAASCQQEQTKQVNQQLQTDQPEVCGPQELRSRATSQSKQNIQPFESIKSQLKKNLVPNAQLIQRHIDNLISRNEAIVDNWNSVSIRSYNSSRDSNNVAGAATIATGPQHVRKLSQVDKMATDSATMRVSEQIFGDRQLESAIQNLSLKRASVAGMNDDPVGQHQKQQVVSPTFTRDDCNHITTSPISPSPSTSSTSTSTAASAGAIAAAPPAPQATAATEPLATTAAAPPPVPPPLATTQTYGLDVHQQPNQHQNLTADGNNMEKHKQHRDELLLTALLMERHRQSLAELESQAALLYYQQQMIEQQQHLAQQVQQFACLNQQQASQSSGMLQDGLLQHDNIALSGQLHATTNHHQHQHHHQQQHPLPLPLPLPHLHHSLTQQDHQHHQNNINNVVRHQSNICDSEFLNGFLSSIMSSVAASSSSSSSSPSTPFPQQLTQHTLEPTPTAPLTSTMTTIAATNLTPLHRCDTCDVSFWTRDLLNYHLITQCANRSHQLGASSAITSNTSTTYSNNNSSSNSSSSSSSSSILKKQLTSDDQVVSTIQHQHHHQLNHNQNQHPIQQQHHQNQQRAQTSTSGTSDQFLPFKKRKISEPIMKYY